MSFPETRLTLIKRLSGGGSEADWREFLHDYWGPVCGFAMRWGGLAVHDAEDVAAETFQTLIRSDLLARWRKNRAARLRTLLCAVARNIIANQARIDQGRKRILRELAQKSQDEIPDSIWTDAQDLRILLTHPRRSRACGCGQEDLHSRGVKTFDHRQK